MRIATIGTWVGLALIVTFPWAAGAQGLNSPNSLRGGDIIGAPPQAKRPAPAPPPALPGARTNTETEAPSTRPASDMEPTDALFDAINRGDIGAARDAISRGADLHGHNVLGMTPIELSVDLGRNDISFMLLSMRGSDEDKSTQPPAPPAAKPPPVRQAKQVPPRPAPKIAASAPVQPQTARLFSGDGGTPNPTAGFLGFDTGHR
jgi:hypothetical protein